jgi:MerR family copper efflux transcriptional regulator
MDEPVTISALSRRTGVPSKTLRYWERLGLLPRAGRTHTGYRQFPPSSVVYVEFISKAKSIGLTLKEMKHVLELARQGRNPCPEVMRWVEQKAERLEAQIQWLRGLQRRLNLLRREWAARPMARCLGEDELCCLIESLPLAGTKGGKHDAQIVRHRNRGAGSAGGHNRHSLGGGL